MTGQIAQERDVDRGRTSARPGAPVANSWRLKKPVRPTARMLIAVPLMIWSTLKVIDEHGVQQRHQRRRPAIAASSAEQRGCRCTTADREAGERRRQHHPLDGDVHDPGALADDPGQRPEHERRALDDRDGEQRDAR